MEIMKNKTVKQHNVAIFQRIFPLYRKALFDYFCNQAPSKPQYTLYFGNKHPSRTTIKTIDALDELPKESIATGRFHWLRNIWLSRDCLWQRGVLRHALGSRYDTLIFEGCVYHLSTWVATILGRLRGKRVLFWTHGFRREEKGLKAKIRVCFYKLASGLLLYGKRGKMLCEKIGIPGDRLYVVNNALDLMKQVEVRESLTPEVLEQCRSKLFKNPDLPILVWIGRLTIWRQLDMLLEAAGRLKDKGTPVNVLLVGDGHHRKGLEELTQKLGIQDYTCIYGACYDEKLLGPMICMSSVLVSPGPVGLSCMHSLVYGVPVITNDNLNTQGPEVDIIIPGETGDFFRENDFDDMMATIGKWLDITSKTSSYKRRCYEEVLRYSPEYQVSITNLAVLGMPATE